MERAATQHSGGPEAAATTKAHLLHQIRYKDDQIKVCYFGLLTKIIIKAAHFLFFKSFINGLCSKYTNYKKVICLKFLINRSMLNPDKTIIFN